MLLMNELMDRIHHPSTGHPIFQSAKPIRETLPMKMGSSDRENRILFVVNFRSPSSTMGSVMSAGAKPRALGMLGLQSCRKRYLPEEKRSLAFGNSKRASSSEHLTVEPKQMVHASGNKQDQVPKPNRRHRSAIRQLRTKVGRM